MGKDKNKEPMTFVVPGNLKEARGVIDLLTAEIDRNQRQLAGFQWEMGAIAYVFKTPEMTWTQLGKLLNTGSTTAKAYCEGYQWGIENGHAVDPKPGQKINLPVGVKFPPTGHDRPANEYDDQYATEAAKVGVSLGSAKRVGINPSAVEAAVAADPKIAQAAERGIKKRNHAALERLMEAGRKAQAEAEAKGVDVSHHPVEHNASQLSQTGEAMISLGEVADKVVVIRDLVAQAKAELDALIEEQGAVGDSYIVGVLQETGELAIDIGAAVMSFTMSNQEV